MDLAKEEHFSELSGEREVGVATLLLTAHSLYCLYALSPVLHPSVQEEGWYLSQGTVMVSVFPYFFKPFKIAFHKPFSLFVCFLKWGFSV